MQIKACVTINQKSLIVYALSFHLGRMYFLVIISALISLSEIRARTLPYYDDIQVMCAIIGALAILVGFGHYLFKSVHKSTTLKDTGILADNKKHFTDSDEIKKETANQNTPRHYNPSTLPEYSERLKQFVTENRSDELRKALTYLEKHKILLISGVGGVGKSTLSRALVDRRPANIPEPFWFDFSSNKSVKLGDILEKLASYLEAPEISSFKKERRKPGKYDVDKLTDELKKRVQIWLFFEDLSTVLEDRKFSDKEIELLFYGLRYNAYNGKIIITSRVVPVFENGEDLLDKTEEEKFHLSGLEKKFAIEYLSSNGLDKVEPEKLEELAKAVDGHPLALKLLVEVVKEHGVTVALNDLSRFQDKKEDIILKARKLFDKLAGEEKELLEYISVYREPVGIEGIEEMLRENVPKTAVDKLMNKSLLETDHNGSYWLHPLVQEFAYDDLEDKKGVHKFAMDYYLSLPIPEKPAKKEDIQSLIEAHYHACMAEGYEQALDIILDNNMSEYLYRWGNYAAIIDIYSKLLPENHFGTEILLKNKGSHGIALGNLGVAYNDLGELRKAIEYYEQALKISQEIGDRNLEGNQLGNLGIAYRKLGETRKAIEYHEKALKNAQENGNREGEGTRLGNLGLAYSDLGETKKAIEYYEQALKISQENGDSRVKGNQLGSLGNAYFKLGEPRKAIEYYEQALKISREIGYRSLEGNQLGNLGNAYFKLGEPREAIEYYKKALKIAKEIRDKHGEGSHLGNLGVAYCNLGETKKAIEYFEQSLKIDQEIGDKRGEGTDLENLGVAYSNLGETRKAIECYEQALKISQEIGDRNLEGNQLGNLGVAYSNLGETRKAIECYEQALKISQEIGDRNLEGNQLGNLGVAYSNLGETRKAIEYFEQSFEINPEDVNACYNKACADSLMNKRSEALTYLKRAVELDPKYKEYAKSDKDFQNLWDENDFKDIIAANKEN